MLAKNLKLLLEEKEITVGALAKATGVPKSTLATWLSGRTPDLIQLDKVAQYLGTNIEALAFGRNQEDLLSQMLTKTEIHTGLYEISIKKIVKK